MASLWASSLQRQDRRVWHFAKPIIHRRYSADPGPADRPVQNGWWTFAATDDRLKFMWLPRLGATKRAHNHNGGWIYGWDAINGDMFEEYWTLQDVEELGEVPPTTIIKELEQIRVLSITYEWYWSKWSTGVTSIPYSYHIWTHEERDGASQGAAAHIPNPTQLNSYVQAGWRFRTLKPGQVLRTKFRPKAILAYPLVKLDDTYTPTPCGIYTDLSKKWLDYAEDTIRTKMNNILFQTMSWAVTRSDQESDGSWANTNQYMVNTDDEIKMRCIVRFDMRGIKPESTLFH